MSARWVGRSLAWALGVCAALAACAGQSAPAPGRVPVVAARLRVEPIGGRVLARIDAGGLDVVSIVPAGGLLWVSSTEQRRLTEVDPRRNVVVGHLALPGHAGTVVSVGGNLWVLLAPERLLVMVDPRRRRIVRFARVEAPQWPTSLAVGDG